MPEDEEEKKKTEADKEKFGGLCKVQYLTWHGKRTNFYRFLHLAGDEGHLGQEDREGGRLQPPRRFPLLYCHLAGNSQVWIDNERVAKFVMLNVHILTLSTDGQRTWSGS